MTGRADLYEHVTGHGLTEREAYAVQLLATEAKKAMERVWTRRVCLPASRLAVEFLRSLGTPANPVAVDLVYENDAFRERVAAEGEPPDQETLMRWRAEGAIRGGIIYHAEERFPDAYKHEEDAGDGWEGGHCVVTFKAQDGQRWLLDLTADQANAPEHGLVFDVVMVPVPDDWVKGESTAHLRADTPHGGIDMMYQAHPEDQSHLETEAWQCYDDPFDMSRSLVLTLKSRMDEAS